MDRLSALSRGMQIMLGAGVLLLIDTFLPWQDYGEGGLGEIAEELGADLSFSAWHGFWGWVMGLALIVLLAWLVARIAGVDVSLPISETMIVTALAVLIFVFALIKNLVDDESTIWSYIGVLLAAALVFGAWLQLQAAGGVDTLRTEMDTMRSRPPTEPTSTSAPTARTEQPAQPTPPPPAQPTTSPQTTTPPTAAPPPPSSTQPPGEPPPPSSEPTH